MLYPRAHYRTLPAYLRALERVVSVTSGADVFPLPQSVPLPPGMVDASIPSANGDRATSGTVSGAYTAGDNALGSDESLGGALLTPIEWLDSAVMPGKHT